MSLVNVVVIDGRLSSRPNIKYRGEAKIAQFFLRCIDGSRGTVPQISEFFVETFDSIADYVEMLAVDDPVIVTGKITIAGADSARPGGAKITAFRVSKLG